MAPKDTLELGRIGSPYGIKGWVHVRSFTDPPGRLLKCREWILEGGRLRGFTPGAVPTEQPRGSGREAQHPGQREGDAVVERTAAGERLTLRLVEGRPQGAGFVARLEGITDRDAAQRLQGARISVLRSALPKLRRNQFYQADLIGLGVANVEGAELGRVAHFVETPGGSVMVVRGDSGREHWVPATKTHLVKVDLEAGRITVDWPADLESSGSEDTPEGE
ncbi:MAG: 16S rRNA processing protein RimM [Steroidobacteraceae bacterium]|nr:16S rRNA processing protein RimM [Steroidobacteraceae bacterium]